MSTGRRLKDGEPRLLCGACSTEAVSPQFINTGAMGEPACVFPGIEQELEMHIG